MSFHTYRDGRAQGSRTPDPAVTNLSPRFSFSLPGDLLERVADEAERRRLPAAQIIREALRERYLDRSST